MKTKRKRDESPQRVITKRTYNKKRRRHANKEATKDTLSTPPEDSLLHIKSSLSTPCVNLSNMYNLNNGHCESLRNDLQHVLSLNLESCHSLTDDDFSTLFGFHSVETSTPDLIRVLEPVDDSTPLKLESLNLTRTNIGDVGVAALVVKCKNLKHLYLSHTRITDFSLSLIAQHCSNLQTLEVVGCEIGNYGLQLIAQQFKARLVSLDVSDCYRVNDAIIPYLCFYCPNLERIGLRNTKIPDRGVSALLRKLKFTSLNIEALPITDLQLCQISQLQPSLRVLHLSFCYGISLPIIKKMVEQCKTLSEVHLFGLGITPEVLIELQREGLSIYCD